MTDRTAQARPPTADAGATAEFERLYRANVDAVTAYFARRSADPQVVADLTADTFVAAITGFGSFDPRKGTARAWVFGIARRVYAAHCETYRQQQHKIAAAGCSPRPRPGPGRGAARPDRRRTGRPAPAHRAWPLLPERDRAVVELVDIAGLTAEGGGGRARAAAGHGADAADAGPRPPAQGSSTHTRSRSGVNEND